MERDQLVVFVALVALAGCARTPRLELRELPGFSIMLPADAVTTKLDYARGALMVGTGSPRTLVRLSWEPGAKTEAEQLRLLLPTFELTFRASGPATLTTVPGPMGKPVVTTRIPMGETSFLLTEIQCGGRKVTLIAGEALYQRMLMSFQCKPDPAAEATLADVPIDLQLDLPGWYLFARENNQLQLSDGLSVLVLQPMAASTPSEVVSRLAPMVPSLFEGLAVDSILDDQLRLRGTMDGEPAVGWLKLISCPTSKTLAIAVAPDKAAADVVDRAVTSATCLIAGAPRQTWPRAPASGLPEAMAHPSDTATGETTPAPK